MTTSARTARRLLTGYLMLVCLVLAFILANTSPADLCTTP